MGHSLAGGYPDQLSVIKAPYFCTTLPIPPKSMAVLCFCFL